jgi:putative Holliday junction resolvase
MPETAPPSGYILAFDYGLRRIGVAVGQSFTGTATALETVSNGREPNWAALDRLVAEWKPTLLLVGLPLGREGDETDMSRAARRFGDRIGKRFDRPVGYVDERLSSRVAQARFAEQRAAGDARRKDAGRMDAMAAQVICENWLASRDA